ncbi:MAG: DNA polymerase III subunit beta [Armatimonadetes bacterium]|nr:DNA polymerase III subunit beta [Armatimonadota bacterium]
MDTVEPTLLAPQSANGNHKTGHLRAIVDRRALGEAVATALRAVPTRSALPIQSHFLLAAEGNQLRITGSDYELQIEQTLPAQVASSGSATVLARVFADLVSTLPDADVQLVAEESDKVLLTCMSSEYELLGLPAEEFPPMPEVSGDNILTITGGLVKELVRQTAFAASDDPSRPQLTGLNVVAEGNEIKLCGAEMARLALRSDEMEQPVSGSINAIIPARAMVEVSRILGNDVEGETLEIGVTQNQVVFRLPNVTVVSRLIDGKFPNFEKVIPKEWSKKITVSTDALLIACRRSLAVAGDSKRLLFSTQDQQLHIKAESGGTGRGHEVVEVVKEGDDIEIAFDGKLLVEFLGIVGAEAVDIELTAPLSPGVIRPVDGESLVYIQMPMHLM